MTKLRNPNRYDIHPIKFTTRVGFQTWEMSGWEFRDLVRLYHVLKNQRHTKKCEDIKVYTELIAEKLGYDNFDIEENVSLKDLGLDKDV